MATDGSIAQTVVPLLRAVDTGIMLRRALTGPGLCLGITDGHESCA